LAPSEMALSIAAAIFAMCSTVVRGENSTRAGPSSGHGTADGNYTGRIAAPVPIGAPKRGRVGDLTFNVVWADLVLRPAVSLRTIT
jgi:hypothetical protein